MDFILGSGLIGYLAKHILGNAWQFIPFKRSRFYTFEVPFADNFITYDEKIESIMNGFGKDSPKIFYKRPFSYQGQLMYQDFPSEYYLQKVYGQETSLLKQLLKTTFTVYDITAKQLHDKLQEKFVKEIQEAIVAQGEIIRINLTEHKIICRKGEFEYGRIISTIPLDVLCKLCGLEMDLKARPVCFYRIKADTVNVEGADQVLVADGNIDFFKVQVLDKDEYLFWTFEPLEKPYEYFGAYLGYRIDILEAKRIENVIPLGESPKIAQLDEGGVICVGSLAQWDDFMDVSSAMRRLLRC